ncbi:MAG: homoserine kinase, partial [Nitrososphaera sp.]|uniref:homoserine kinase n=1 Tax=Nitrososphaera sp. TaxID=1971748 RepID=UPI003D700446
MRLRSRTAAAPCSTANLGPGYDVFGLALDALQDTVKITAGKDSGGGPGRILMTILNSETAIPVEVENNSAGLVVKKMAQDFGIRNGLRVTVKKGIPAGYGIGSSAASAAAAAVAFKSLYNLKIDTDAMVEYAAEGEVASAGTKHYDNVSASLLGGFVISCVAGSRRNFIRIAPPKDLVLVVAIPSSVPVPERKTQLARSVLPKEVPLHDVVRNVASASTIVAGIA